MDKLKQLFIQALKFFGISGIGWLIDFSIFIILHKFVGDVLVLDFKVIKFDCCNVFSMLCGVTFVFFVSTRKTFSLNLNRFSLKQKYGIYIGYQLVMLILASFIIGAFITLFAQINAGIMAMEDPSFILNVISKCISIFKPEICAKICVTPITMVCNFIFMKILTENV